MVTIQDLSTGRRPITLRQIDGEMTLVWSPDGTRLATTGNMSGGGGMVTIQDLSTGRRPITLPDTDRVTTVVWSPDGTRLATAGLGGVDPVRVWDPVTGRDPITLPGTDDTTTVVWSPDGAHLAVSTARQIVVIACENWTVRSCLVLGARIALRWHDNRLLCSGGSLSPIIGHLRRSPVSD